jgi:dihydroflavonol-4-reductase
MKRTTLVTGATGFLGSRIVRALVASGERVRVLARPGSSRRAFADLPEGSVEVAEGDITVGHTVYRALAGCDRMFHAAAVVKMWHPDPREVVGTAVIGMRETLEAARRRDLERIVVTSSVATLGTTPGPEPMDEGKELNLDDPEQYTLAKVESERVAQSFADEGLPVVLVSPGALFGPGDHRPSLGGDLVLRYLGWSMPFGFPCAAGGISVVDVDDCARGHLLAMQHGAPRARYLLGGENVTWRRLFDLLSALSGRPSAGADTPHGLAVLGGRAVDLWTRLFGGEPVLTYRVARDYVGAYQWISSARAEAELGYAHRPAVETLTHAVRFFLEHGHLGDAARHIHLDLTRA